MRQNQKHQIAKIMKIRKSKFAKKKQKHQIARIIRIRKSKFATKTKTSDCKDYED